MRASRGPAGRATPLYPGNVVNAAVSAQELNHDR
jgi:hypothetical protein